MHRGDLVKVTRQRARPADIVHWPKKGGEMEWRLVRQGSPNGAYYSSLGQSPCHHKVKIKP